MSGPRSSQEGALASESAAWATQLATCCGDIAVALGVRDTPDAIERELRWLFDEPVALHAAHPNWPSAMASLGPPVEISLRLDWSRPAALRFVVDVTDHRVDLAANWRRYIAYAEAVLGPEADSLAITRMCRSHLSGIAPESRSRMLHGVGYARQDARRATLYFRNWLTSEIIIAAGSPSDSRFKELYQAVDRPAGARVELVGYDFSGGLVERVKLYYPLDLPQAASTLVGVPPTDPYLGAARRLSDTFGEEAGCAEHSTWVNFLQVALDGRQVTQKLLFPCATWGWAASKGFLRLVHYLDSQLRVDLEPLGLLLDRLAAHGIVVSPSFVAISGDQDTPSVTFYLAPVSIDGVSVGTVGAPLGDDRPSGLGQPPQASARTWPTGIRRETPVGDDLAGIDDMIARGLQYVWRLQGDDGLWQDYEVLAAPDVNGGRCQVEGVSTDFVSAYVGSCLAALPSAHGAVALAAAALWSRYKPGHGWGWNERAPADAETTALAMRLITSSGLAHPDGCVEALLRHRCPDGGFQAYAGRQVEGEAPGAADVTAAAVLALLRCGDGTPSTAAAISGGIRRLRMLQRGTGGWPSVWWTTDLVATARAIEALNEYTDWPSFAEVGEVRARIVSAADALIAWPVPTDPCALGHWLVGWRAVGGNRARATVHRVIGSLRRQQRRDGAWLGVPNRRIPREVAGRSELGWDAATVVIDGSGLVTTATVLAGLSALRAVAESR